MGSLAVNSAMTLSMSPPAGGGTPTPVPTLVTRQAVNILGPGHSDGNGRATSTGVLVTSGPSYTNRSGAPITQIGLVFSGWWLGTTGTSAIGNDYPVSAIIEYPVGTPIATITSAGNATIIVPNGTDIVTDTVDISATPIPANATFKVSISSTTTSGLFYASDGLGLTGVLTTAMSDTLKKEVLYALGDSIMTNNGAAVHTVANATTGCPSMQMSISGTRAEIYAAGAMFDRQVALAKRLGATRFLSNFGTNDFGAGRTLAQLQASLTTLRDKAAAEGIAWTQTTMTPRTTNVSVAATSAPTGSGNTITIPVPDASLFDVGLFYVVAGAVETGYNGTRVCSSVDAVGNTVSFISQGVSGSPATGSVTVTGHSATSTRLQNSPAWEADRLAFNAWVRGGALGTSHIDWADACEPSRDAGRWATCLESAFLRSSAQLGTITSVINTTRFNSSGTAVSGNGGAGGVVQWASDLNIGTVSGVNGTNGGDITLSSAPASAFAVGHTFYIHSNNSRATDDGLHPRVAVGAYGGQAMLTTPTASWLTGLLA